MAVQTPAPAAPAVNAETWLDQVIQAAMSYSASDMLLRTTPRGDVLVCDIRIDGRMRPFAKVQGDEATTIVGRFKAQANLASGGSYKPEETIYPVLVDGEYRKVRVALFRTAEGSNAIVMRLPPHGPLRRLEELGFSDHNLTLMRDLLTSRDRMTIIAGPMGSGKTTTAHAALLEVSDRTRTVWTIEDPVERTIPGLVQLEVDEENNAGFDALLKTLVRSDYDTLFLGEIRDHDTASAGVKQAKAGRQVITTLHANDNVTALLRLLELAGESPLSVLDSVRGVVSQRLLARRNPAWREGMDPLERYRGRVPVHEVTFVTEDLVEAIMDQRPLGQIRDVAARKTMSTFRSDAARLVAEGVTDQAEVIRTLGLDLEHRDVGAPPRGPAQHQTPQQPTSPQPAMPAVVHHQPVAQQLAHAGGLQ